MERINIVNNEVYKNSHRERSHRERKDGEN